MIKVLENENISIMDFNPKRSGVNPQILEITEFLEKHYDRLVELRGTTKCLVIQLEYPGVKWPTREEAEGNSRTRNPSRSLVFNKIRLWLSSIKKMSGPNCRYRIRQTYLGDGKFALWWMHNESMSKRIAKERAKALKYDPAG